MKPPPVRCYSCGGLVDVDAVCPHGWPLILDLRLPDDRTVIAPPLCWTCRGAVILGAN